MMRRPDAKMRHDASQVRRWCATSPKLSGHARIKRIQGRPTRAPQVIADVRSRSRRYRRPSGPQAGRHEPGGLRRLNSLADHRNFIKAWSGGPVSRQCPRNPEPDVAAPVVDAAPDAVSGAEGPRPVAPRAPAQHPAGTVPTGPRTTILWRTSEAVIPAILDPLPHVTVHVIEAPGIGFKLIYRRRLRTVLAFLLAPLVGRSGINRRSSPEGRGSARPSRVFPFCF